MQENFYYRYYDWKKQNDFKNSNVAEIKNWGLMTGMCVLAYVLFGNLVSVVIRFTPFYELYSQNDIIQNVTGIFTSVVSIFLPFFLLSLLHKKGSVLKSLNFSKPETEKGFASLIVIGFAVCMIANFVATWILGLFTMVGFDPNTGSTEVNPSTSLIGFFMYAIKIAVIPALVEEFAVRGVMMQPLRKYGDGFAIMASSIIFALMHGSIVQGIFAFIVGLTLGYLTVATGSIWTGVLIHFINNLFSVVVSGIGTVSILAGNIFYWVIVIPVIIAGIIFSIKNIRSGKIYRLRKPQIYMSGNEKMRAFVSNPAIIISIIILGITAIIGLV